MGLGKQGEMKMRKLLRAAAIAAGLFAMSTITAFAANGWVQENGQWVYYDRDSKVYNEWKTGADGSYYYLGGNGYMTVNDFVDERYHVEKATRAACKYLKQAYARFGNWETVAASYNAGQGRISREQERQYTDNALDLYLVEETSRYVYRILAAKIMLNNPQLFGFRLKRSDLYPPIPYRTIKVTSSISDLPRFAKSQGITYALLINMNPWLRGRSLPNHSHKEYIIRIPDEKGMHYNPLMTFPHEKKWVTD